MLKISHFYAVKSSWVLQSLHYSVPVFQMATEVGDSRTENVLVGASPQKVVREFPENFGVLEIIFNP